MQSNPDATKASIQGPEPSGHNEWLDKISKLQSESDENKVRLSKEMVVACLDDCQHKKGTVHKMMEARVLPVLVLELRKELSVELRIGFQVLFDTILHVVSENGVMPLSNHFPTLLALSQNKDFRIAEPVIETIGLISHNLSSREEVDEFLRSGILEWLVEAVRTHPDGQVRQAIVVGLGEIGFGLKKAVVREKRGDEGWKRRKKMTARGVEGRGRRDGGAGRWLLGSLSRADLLMLKSVSCLEEDTHGMDLASRCRRGVRMAGQALVGVIHEWEEQTPSQRGKRTKEPHEEDEEDEEEDEEAVVGVLDIAGSVCALIFPELYQPRQQVTMDRIAVSGKDLEDMARQLANQGQSPATISQADLLEKERKERKAEQAQFQEEKREMQRLIDELRQNQPPSPSTKQIPHRCTDPSKWSRSVINRFKKTAERYSTIVFADLITTGIWQLTLSILKLGENHCSHVGFFQQPGSSSVFPDGKCLGLCNTSLSFCPNCNNIAKCHQNDDFTTHCDSSFKFKEGNRIMLEVNMDQRTCHLFVNDKQASVFVKKIPDKIQFAVTLREKEDEFEVISVTNGKAKAVPDKLAQALVF
ncbi:hypothetical protein BLNAU_16708 [Blattamonas nauphoetae]|uniref:Uncharacterized protein n=1 Tax=Blattamonas nauphoetae TaxID=2049346 RepID=A0ABQ9XAS8_9EUKA|nr:hypothetical protein BLNAU_16708 [Blattamonas nauphoetae]